MYEPDPHRADADVDAVNRAVAAARPDGLACQRCETGDGTTRLVLSGELDTATAPELDHALRTAQQNAQRVAVDLRRLSFMDCRGLTALLNAAARADETGSRFRVVRGPPHIHRLFELTGTDRRFEITPEPVHARGPLR